MRVVREPHIADTIVLVDGVPACGKTMMAPIVGSFDRVELMQYNYPLQSICVLRDLNLIASDVATVMIRIHTDLDLYDSMMSRETNFRFSDLSSVWRNSRPWRYFQRLFQPGDDATIPKIEKERPILHLVTHSMLGRCAGLFEALGDRLRIIEVVRHPLYMIKQWYGWIHRAGVDARTFHIWIDHHGHAVPDFAHGWEDLFLKSNRMDRTIYAIDADTRLAHCAYTKLSGAQKRQVLIVPFETFVTKPDPYLRELAALLDTGMTSATSRMMKKQNVPRKMYADGADLKIYRKYGWEPPDRTSSEVQEFQKRRDFAAAEASPDAMSVLDRMCEQYEVTYLRA